MRRLLLALSLICIVYSSHTAYGQSLKVPQDRVVRIQGPIEYLRPQIVEFAMLVVKAPAEPVYVMLDTPGGNVDGGMEFIEVMRAYQRNGGKIVCVAKSAVSMGMAIYSECNERYALKTANILWHPVRTYTRGPITPKQAKEMYDNLSKLDEVLWGPTKKALQVSDKVWQEHYDAETMHTGESLKKLSPNYLKLIDKVEGAQFYVFDPLQDLLDQFSDPSVPDEAPAP